MGILRELFGPSRKEVWQTLSTETGNEFIDGGFFGSDKVIAHVGEWTVTLDTYTVSNGKTSTTYTRMRAPYVNKDGIRFTIYRSGFFSELGAALGFRDIEVGFSPFDEAFVIKGSDEQKIRELFADELIRELIERQPSFKMQVKDDEGWFGDYFPEGVDELYFSVPGVIKDIEQLKELFELFAEVLHRLCVIGSAYEGNPGIELS